jgi:CubicO group peptidase (beta-lactamase class C family)
MHRGSDLLAVMATGVLGLVLGPGFTASAAQAASVAQAAETSRTAAHVERFFDAAMAAQMTEHGIAGGVVSVVEGGQILFQKGYGYADVDDRKPVDPQNTMFRVGSLTKIFTATAVMQLVEAGSIRLDADINTYLDFRIPATFDRPITMHDLLTHTAGFESRWIGVWPSTSAGVEPLGSWLSAHIPTRMRPPGVVTSYSNYGLSLAGYVVERVSRMAFADYLDQNILGPLKMIRTSAHQPVRAMAGTAVSTGYDNVGKRFRPRPFEWLNMAPAGVVSSSGQDMAQFMIAHLQLGRLGSTRILEQRIAKLMQTQHFSNVEGFNGVGYGFYETSRNGQSIIGHGGDTDLFHSVLALLPEHDVGVFVSFNSATAAQSAEQVRNSFLNEFFPPTPDSAAPANVGSVKLGQLTGSYRLTNTAYSTAEKITGLFGSYRVSKSGQNLVVTSPAGDELFADRSVAFQANRSDSNQFQFDEIDGQDSIAFRIDKQTGKTFLFVDHAPVFSLERLRWFENPLLHDVVIGGSLLVLISGLVVFPFSRRRQTRLARWATAAMGALGVALPIGLLLVVSRPQSLISGNTTFLAGVLIIPMLIGLGSIGIALLVARAWKNGEGTLVGRIHLCSIAASGIALTIVLNYWNLVGWKY